MVTNSCYYIQRACCDNYFSVFAESSLLLHINWASEASPTLGCSIEISRDIYIYIYIYIYVCVCRMSNHVESRESNTRMLKVSIGW